ncbi:unnamed protein product [Ectocarpus sp. 8 AP-2014]
MDKSISQNLLGHVSRWQLETIEALETNSADFFDMAWLFDGVFYRDCRQLYSSRSDYFKCLFSSSMRKGTEEFEGVTAYSVSHPMSKRHIFDMMRVFCHTGMVQVDKGEPILKTMERYSAFHYYSLRGGMDVIRQLIMDVINPTNAIQALEYAMGSAVCFGDGDGDGNVGLLSDIKDYISIYAFVVFKHKSFYALGADSISGVSQICARDDLNIKEIDLLQCVYKLCEKKVATEKELGCLGSAWALMTHDSAEPGSSLWSQIRLSSISMREFVKFIKENKRCFSSDNALKIITFLYSCGEAADTPPSNANDEVAGLHLSKKRKTFQPISFYPRNLEFHGFASPQTDISYWDDSKIKLFVAFDFSSKEAMTLPPVHFHNFFIHCTVYHADRCLNVSGNIHGKTNTNDSSVTITVTASVVNFRHDRWRKKNVLASLSSGTAFKIPTILSSNTIGNNDTPGYLFDIERYPEYSPKGNWILMSLCIEK